MLGLQSGVPFSSAGPLEQLATALGLAVAMRRFRRATTPGRRGPRGQPGVHEGSRTLRRPNQCRYREDADRLVERYGPLRGIVSVEEVDPYPMLPEGAGPVSEGLYGPDGGRNLTVVELPTTTLAQRARSRLGLRKSLYVRRLRGR